MEAFAITFFAVLFFISRSLQSHHSGLSYIRGREIKRAYRLAKKLSKDAEPVRLCGGYLVYAYKREWYFQVSCGIVHSSFKLLRIYADPLRVAPYDDKWRVKVINDSLAEFDARWISTRLGMKCTKYIMRNYPN